jgi:hypothetical protein
MSALGQKRTYAVQKGHVRFTPNSDRESGFPQQAISALPPKAGMCGATRDVCFGPTADNGTAGKLDYSITSSAREIIVGGTDKPIAFAAFKLTTSSNFVGSCTGSSEGLAPFRMRSTYDAARPNKSGVLLPKGYKTTTLRKVPVAVHRW